MNNLKYTSTYLQNPPWTPAQLAHIAEVKKSPLGQYLEEYSTERKTFMFYHYTSWDNFKKICESGKFKLSKLGESNDPFEFLPPFEHGADRRRWDKFRSVSIFASVSLSTRMSSPPMWAHYAKNHTGVCLAFRIPIQRSFKGLVMSTFHLDEDVLSFMFNDHILAKMIYKNTRPAIDYNFERPLCIRFKKAVYEAMIYKSSDWSYENEFKLFVGGEELPECDRPNLLFSGLLPQLHGVILGINCNHKVCEARRCLQKLHTGYVKVVKAKRLSEITGVVAEKFQDTNMQSLEEWSWDSMDFYRSASDRGLMIIPEDEENKF